jgi:hypothetical protein
MVHWGYVTGSTDAWACQGCCAGTWHYDLCFNTTILLECAQRSRIEDSRGQGPWPQQLRWSAVPPVDVLEVLNFGSHTCLTFGGVSWVDFILRLHVTKYSINRKVSEQREDRLGSNTKSQGFDSMVPHRANVRRVELAQSGRRGVGNGEWLADWIGRKQWRSGAGSPY